MEVGSLWINRDSRLFRLEEIVEVAQESPDASHQFRFLAVDGPVELLLSRKEADLVLSPY
jgi:hypothetical protein